MKIFISGLVLFLMTPPLLNGSFAETRMFQGFSAKFVTIKAGTFQMGSSESEYGRDFDEYLHTVKLTKKFEIQQTEITQAHWFLVMGHNPSRYNRRADCPEDYLEINGAALCPNHPVTSVSWNDVQEFIKKLNAFNDGYAYRLPTEAEWEYAARGGTQTAYSFGNDDISLGDYAWYAWYLSNSLRLHAVGSKKPNQYDLYDMHGNAAEWVQDWHASYPFGGGQRNPKGPKSGRSRVYRGGAHYNWASDVRAAYRYKCEPYSDTLFLGFRLVRTAKGWGRRPPTQ